MPIQQRPSNQNTSLTITSNLDGKLDGREVLFDFPTLKIGVAQYPEGPTGCTVFYFPTRGRFAVDVRGGSPGVLLLGQWESGERFVDAICLTGGSVYGMEAITGIYPEMLAHRDYATDWQSIASILGAVIFDYGPRQNAIYPDSNLGRVAFRSAVTGRFPLGPIGAGSSATVGKLVSSDSWELAGQGGAFCQVGVTKIAVFSVVNSCGAIYDRSGKIVRGNLDRKSGQRFALKKLTSNLIADGGNTTLTVLVTNQKLTPFSLRQIGKQVHTSMARAIQPFHTWRDGDVFFTVSTEEVENPDLADIELGTIASEMAWDAVLNSF